MICRIVDRLRSRASSEVRAIGAAELPALVSAGASVVDVRTPGEWHAGHLPVAVHIPMDELVMRMHEIDHSGLTILVCRSGHRSKVAATALAARGFDVADLRGGMQACARAGIEIVRPGGAPGTVV